MKGINLNEIFMTNEGCEFKIIHIESSSKIKIKFMDNYGYEKLVRATNIRNREIKNPFHKSLYGIGMFGVGEFKSKINNKITYEYAKWQQMMSRAYDVHTKLRQKAYQECSVREDWHNFQDFSSWLINQKGYGLVGWQLDKDLLVEGNKEYSPDCCVIVPPAINNTLTGSNQNNGLPRGVCWHIGAEKYIAQCRVNSKIIHLGYYYDIISAKEAYNNHKLTVLKDLAEVYRDNIDVRLYTLLMNFPSHRL